MRHSENFEKDEPSGCLAVVVVAAAVVIYLAYHGAIVAALWLAVWWLWQNT